MTKPKNAKGTLRRLLGYLKPHKVRLILVSLCILGATLASTTGTYLLKTVVDDYLRPMAETHLAGQTVNFGPFFQFLTTLMLM